MYFFINCRQATDGNDENLLDNYYASLLDASPWDDNPFCKEVSSDEEELQDTTCSTSSTAENKEEKHIKHVLDDLAAALTFEKISIFNISRSYIWEGTKRALLRKRYSPKDKIDVKFTDESGNSEGAVDMGGPMREYFTLAIRWIESHMFCGAEGKYLKYQAKFLEEDDYYFAGMVVALSLVHGGPGPQFLAPQLYGAIIGQQANVSLDDVYDMELKSSLQNLLKSTSKEEANNLLISDATLSTTMELEVLINALKN